MAIKKKQMIKNIEAMSQTNMEIIVLLNYIDENVVLEQDVILKGQISNAINHLKNMNQLFNLIKQSM